MHKLEIPENIPLKWELFKGFGAAELFKTCVLAVPVCIVAWLYAQLSSSDREAGEKFILWCAQFAEENDMNVTLTVSDEPEKASEAVKAFLV